MSKAQVDRIKKMESYLDEASEALSELAGALDRYEKIQSKYYKLEEYYSSQKWMEDFEADEAVEEEVSMEQGGLTEDNSIVDTDVSADAEAEEPAAE